jgi:UDP-N-acetyl-D-glucosamine/UDP-N-acetyl-D-galactosamine dehydrogenase
VEVFIHDPLAQAEEAEHEYGLQLSRLDELPKAEAVVIAVAHQAYRQMAVGELKALLKDKACVVDVKGVTDKVALAPSPVWTL